MDADEALSMHNEFSMLDLADLLLARERNHVELVRRKNVIGTAVGLYLIRKKEPFAKASAAGSKGNKPPRTLDSSEVRDYSWPCILAFVDQWKAESELDWQDRIPSALYLDEKRKVPVCVVLANKQQTAIDAPMRPVLYPTSRLGGGFPVMTSVQGREHVASIGCLVRDGHNVYALTNRHVTGPAGEVVYARIGGERVRIGVSASKQLTRFPFTKLYPDFAGKETWANLDVGLVLVDDVNQWSASVFGIGTMGPMADLGMDNLTLRLIDCPVRAYGCASGQMSGKIKALFYRFKSLGGFEYVSDFLIGPRNEGDDLNTHPGDSGTVWLLESKEQGLMPIALQWGGQVFTQEGEREQSSYALATCLSTVCNILNVDVIRDWNLSVAEYWGEVGHFAIGALACTVAFTNLSKLERFMSDNIRQVGFEQADLRDPEKIIRSRAHFPFVPLADVADDVWRTTRKSGGETGDDGNNHFADMDQKATKGKFKGKTLLELCEDPDNVDPTVWDEFYKGVPGTSPGALPFRVRQGYNLMVDALKANDPFTFLCVAGCTAHYVGDACQPLHVSRLHHGFPENATSTSRKVHSVYETDMLNLHTAAIVDGVIAALAGQSVSGSFKGGHGAAIRVVRLMQETVEKLPPEDIVRAYNEEKKPAARVARLWKDFGKLTIDRLAGGCLCMADIWASAWKEGRGEQIAEENLGPFDLADLAELYRKASFFPSMSLARMIPLLKEAEDGSDARPRAARRAGRSGSPTRARKRALTKPSRNGRARRNG